MADVSLSARADVRPLPGAITRRFDCGGTVYAGDVVYIASDGDVEQADADGAASARAIGIAVADSDGGTTFSAGDAVDVVVMGPVAGFSALAEETVHYVSTTAGSIADAAPGSGNYEWIPGYPESSAIFFVWPFTHDLDVQSS